MNFPLYIAKRYLFTKTSNNAINIITIIASFGVIVGALALFIILSGFSGLRTFSYSLLEVSDPDIKITATQGKSFFFTENIQQVLSENKQIKATAKVLEERVFLKYKDKEHIAYVKGVDFNYNQITLIDSAIVIGQWLDPDYINTAVLGEGIANKLSLGGLNYIDPLRIFVPKAGKGFSLNLYSAFKSIDAQVLGVYSGTEEFESKYVFVHMEQAQELLSYTKNQISGIEIALHDASLSDEFRDEIQEQLGESYKVQTKAELNALFYKVINTENFVSYLIFTLIIIIALFNVIGAIIMMIMDKKENLKTLFNMGVTIKDIKKIFVFQGFLLTIFGMTIGLVIGIILVFIQKQFGLFMIVENLPYPVEFRWMNLLVIIATITTLGFIASKIASSRISESFVEK